MAEVRDRDKSWSTGRKKRTHVHRKQETLTQGERRRLSQLVVCMLLFGIVFIGRGLPQGQLSELEHQVSILIHQNTDFRAAFSKVGQSVSEGEPIVQTFGVLCSEVFGDGKNEQDTTQQEEPATLTTETDNENTGEISTDLEQETVSESQPAEEEQAQVAQETETSESETAEKQQNNGNDLLAEETVTPVMGVLTSGFGYRTHPIDGQWKHHDGVDLMADVGTPILAFASGEVEYIGESPAYGLYLQVKHDEGVSTFYAHCSEICVKKGQTVKTGDTIAKVGVTGNTTGPHLHFEVKQNGQRIDPAPYVETITP